MTEQTEEQPILSRREIALRQLEQTILDPVDVPPGSPGWGMLQLMGHNQMMGFVMTSELIGMRMLRVIAPGEDGRWQELGTYSPGAVYGFTPSTKRAVLGSLFWVNEMIRRDGQLALRAPEPLDADEDDADDLDDGDHFDDFDAPGIRAELAAAEKKLAEQTERADKAEAKLKRYQDAAQPEAVKRLEDILHDANTNMDSPDANVLCKALADALDAIRTLKAASLEGWAMDLRNALVFAEQPGMGMIVQERIVQSFIKGYSAAHDDQHGSEELAWAAAALAAPGPIAMAGFTPVLPFIGVEAFKKIRTDRIKALAVAGAFCAAEIERIKRMTKPAKAAAPAAPLSDEEVPDWVTNK